MTMGVPMAGTLSSRAMMLFGSFSGFVGVGGGRMIYLELSIGWKLALAVAVPALLAIAILTAEARGPLSASIQSCKGVVAPYFNGVAMLFSLYAALLASDAWQKDIQARRFVNNETNAARLIAHTAHAMGVTASVLPKLRTYLDSSSGEMHEGTVIRAARGKTETAFDDLVGAIVREPRLDSSSRAILIGEAQTMMRARDDRVHLASDATVPLKGLAMVIFGAITQIALMLVHLGQRRAMRVAVSLFTLAFSTCLVLTAIFGAPFQVFMPNEPRASLSEVLRGL